MQNTNSYVRVVREMADGWHDAGRASGLPHSDGGREDGLHSGPVEPIYDGEERLKVTEASD